MTGATQHAHASLRRPTTFRWLLVSLLLTSFSPNLHAGLGRALKHERHHEIDALEEAWCGAVLRGDADALATLLSDDYIAITARGMLQTKDEALNSLRTRQTRIVSLDISDRKVRFYGSTAVVTSLAQVEGSNETQDISGSFRYTHVYVRNSSGMWKLVSAEASHIPETHGRDQH